MVTLFHGCVPPKVDTPPTKKGGFRILFSENTTLTIVHSGKYGDQNKDMVIRSLLALQDQYINRIIRDKVEDDSLATLIRSLIPVEKAYSNIIDLSFNDDSLTVRYGLDTSIINTLVDPIMFSYGHPNKKMIYPLFTTDHVPPNIDKTKRLRLNSPCTNVSIPTRALLLPNAPRKYRSGIHRGIDFVVNWGTPVYTVAEGVVIRSDRHYEEFDPEFRRNLLDVSTKLGHTPADVFEHILLGRSVFIDHGFNLVPGYRAITIYAHLSHIDNDIKPGVRLSKGEQIGLSGNSGTEDGTLGKRTGAHLHWEMILQNSGGEYYLGQGWSYKEMVKSFGRIFGEQ